MTLNDQSRITDAGLVAGYADLSTCGAYRYTLKRTWDPSLEAVLFIGLNPSTADANNDDPTIRRCVGFARMWGYGAMWIGNLFAFRTPFPAVLKSTADPIGPDNDRWLTQLIENSALQIAAWGVHGRFMNRDVAIIPKCGRLHCLGLTKGGAPKHPLYLPGATQLQRF